MIPTYGTVVARLDHLVRPAFEPARVNLVEAGVKAAEMNKHLAEADNLARYGFREDAQARYEAATIAAADALLALTGGRLTNAYRGRAHGVKKHFIVATLEAAGQRAPSLEDVLVITEIRHLIEYGASVVEQHLTARASDEARQAANLVRRAVLAVLAEARVTVPELPVQRPSTPGS